MNILVDSISTPQGNPDLSLVLPCYNEEGCLEFTVPPLVEAFSETGVSLQVVLVDNGSTDRTSDVIDRLIAQGLPITKGTVPVNRGQGLGFLTGFGLCRGRAIGYICADGQVSPADVLKTYGAFQQASVPCLAKVRRLYRPDSLARKIVSIFYNAAMQILFVGMPCLDVNGNPKIMPADILNLMELSSQDWFLEAEVMLKARHLKLRVIEINVKGQPREAGHSHVRFKTILEFMQNMIAYRFGGPWRNWRSRVNQLNVSKTASATEAVNDVATQLAYSLQSQQTQMKSEVLSDSDNVFAQSDVAFAKSSSRARRSVLLSRALRLSLWGVAILFLVWAIRDSRFRDAEGIVSGAFCLPLAASLASLILGCAISTPIWKSGFWFALALLGQALMLQLINAGHALRYQHYKPFSSLFAAPHLAILLVLGLQMVLVAVGLKPHLAQIRSWLGRNFNIWQLLAITICFFFSSATVSRGVGVYLTELPFATFLQTLNLANIVLVVLTLPGEVLDWFNQKLEGLLGKPELDQPSQPILRERFAICAAIWVVVIAAVLSFFSYQRHPHIADEVVYLYHARYLASGMLTMPAPPVLEAFNIDLMDHENGRWFCPVPPGWPMVLAIGAFFGAPWLVNPLLAGLNILMAYSLLRELYDRRTARLAILLICASPWYLFMAMNFMTHILTVTCSLAAALAVIKSRKTNKLTWALLAGMSAGFVSLIRPLDGVIVAGLIGLWIIGLGGKRLKFSSIVAFVFGCALVGATQLQYNKMLTGDAMKFPINAYNDKYHGHNSNAYGFGPDRGMGWEIDPYPGHGPIDATINANLNITSINFELFGWSIGSLLLVAVVLFAGRLNKSDYLMIGVFVTVFVAYFFYYFSGGPDFGARYWFLVLIPFTVLTVRAVRFLEQKFEVGFSRATAGAGVIVAVLCLSTLSLANYVPWRAIDKYHHYLTMRPDIRVLAKERGFGRSLVLIRGKSHPDYASAAIYNPLNLYDNVPVYAWDRNEQVHSEVLKAYSDRPVWVVNGPSITGRGFEVVEGPVSPQLLSSTR